MKRDIITKMSPNRDYERKAGRYVHELYGSAEQFRRRVDKWRVENNLEPIYKVVTEFEKGR